MGIDPDEPMGDPDWLAKRDPVEREEITAAKNWVAEEYKHTVDLGYYYLTNDAFCAALPELEIANFS